MVTRTRKSGILAIFVFAVCVPAFAQPSLIEQGRAAMQRNDPEAAAKLFEQSVAQNPGSAEAELKRAIALDPNYLDGHRAFALIYNRQNKP
jgi:Tfp pilus assembly protein PilF